MPTKFVYRQLPEKLSKIRDTGLRLCLRLLLFVAIEIGFFSLALVCVIKPVPLHIPFQWVLDRFQDSEIKGAFTTVFILWHSVAALIAGPIILDEFSREWSVRLEDNQLGSNDKVSTLTSDFLDYIHHFWHASRTFKCAFMASLSLMALTKVAPGAINASSQQVDVSVIIEIGKLVSEISSDNDSKRKDLASQTRASLIVSLERAENMSTGLQLPPNTLVPLPPAFHGTILDYDTEVVHFHHECHWVAPSITLSNLAPIDSADWGNLTAGNYTWNTYLAPTDEDTSPGSSISPLWLTLDEDMKNTGASGYLFTGGNASFMEQGATPFGIDLGDLPASILPLGAANIRHTAALASVLICTPSFSISTGHVRLFNNGTVNVTTLEDYASGQTFSKTAANLIFSAAAQLSVLNVELEANSSWVNDIASLTFMNGTIDWEDMTTNTPLDIPSINKNIDEIVGIAAKAFLDGFRKDPTNATSTWDTERLPATQPEERLALVTSTPQFIITCVLVATTTILLSFSRWSAMSGQRHEFNLQNIMDMLAGDDELTSRLFSEARARIRGQQDVEKDSVLTEVLLV
ncbi:hypothetical protein D9756_001205 [Leucocoprinus leucothites]|uniref:Uncharacterized protein n=1 Tax=Leucocoprinus leucothites TaxID=201217 RepID=A0A8H5G412_9AGAR|nr:hypothetical protein D9756_001205 [Leucoagaricus leucothites]